MRPLRVSLFILFAAHTAWAQSAEPLFVDIPGAAIQAPTHRAVIDRREVGMRLDRLFDAAGAPAAQVELNVGLRSWTAVFERLDRDSNGFRSWVGRLDGIEASHVVVTERDGIVSGLIDAIGEAYEIRSANPGSFVLERVDPDLLPQEIAPRSVAADDVAVAPLDRSAAADDAGTIDVLVLYSPAARSRAGGVSQIQSIASQVISDTNTIFGRSAINTRVRLVGTSEFAIVEARDMVVDLDTLEASPTARALRDSAHADLVQLLVLSPDFETCGIANVLRSLNQPNFAAYSVADILCLSGYTPTHEMGHNLSAQHAPEDGAVVPAVPVLLRIQGPRPRLPHRDGVFLPRGSLPENPELLESVGVV